MSNENDEILKVGDMAEFQLSGNPKPPMEWQAQRVHQIRLVEEYDDKEGVLVSEVSWRKIRDYECLVVVPGTGNRARNAGLRPVSGVISPK